MHVRRLPALHDGLAQDLQMGVRLVVPGARIVPAGLAVLSLVEYGQLGGRHGRVLFGCFNLRLETGGWVDSVLHTRLQEEGLSAGGQGFIRWAQEC